MVDSRLKTDPSTLFHCFVDISAPEQDNASKVRFIYPYEFAEKEQILKDLSVFCYPCKIDSEGVEYSTFVLTDLDSKFRFGFCRYPSRGSHCLCIVSYLPWFKTFYSVLDKVSLIFGDITDDNRDDVTSFLTAYNELLIPDPGSQMFLKFRNQTYTFVSPDTTSLPTIPDNRNLTKYYAKITPNNMVSIFVSMLFERRIIVTSEKLSVLTAVVHGSVSLLYPMQWQHIYVPILPPHLIDYVCAPMPFLLGIHSSMMAKVRQMPMNEVVILNADSNEIELPDDGLDSTFPKSVASKLAKRLGRAERASKDYVSSLFLHALADLIGGYRDALKYIELPNEGGKIIFDEDLFLTSRGGNRKLFLESILCLQSFRQFILGRLDMLNDGVGFVDIFEKAIIKRNKDVAAETKFDVWKDKMKKGGGVLKKTVEGKYSHLKGIANEIEVKEEVKEFRKRIKEKVKGKKKEKDGADGPKEATVKRNNSMPINQNIKLKVNHPRHATISEKRPSSLYSVMPKKNITKPDKTPPPHPPDKTPPPRPPRPSARPDHPSSVQCARKSTSNVWNGNVSSSHSADNIIGLLEESSSSSLSSSNYSLDDDEGENSSGSYFNPAFKDTKTEKDLLFDEASEGSPTTSRNNPSQMLDKPKGGSLKRSTPVTQRKRPPPRPPPITPDKNPTNPLFVTGKPPIPPIKTSIKTPPHRPPPPPPQSTKMKLIDLSPEKERKEIDIDNSTDVNKSSEATVNNTCSGSPTQEDSHDTDDRSLFLPSSPFYVPSTDLLDLDQSLFTETMKSLSEDTRSLITNSSETFFPQAISSNVSQTNPFSPAELTPGNPFQSNLNSIENGRPDLIFDDFTVIEMPSKKSPVLTKPTERSNSAMSSDPSDPFASCFEEAKRDFQLTPKSRQLMTNTPHSFRTASVPSYGWRAANNRRRDRRSRNSLMMVAAGEGLFYEERGYNDTL